jgi:hypothetical protein
MSGRPPSGDAEPREELGPEERGRLARIADELIPEGEGMPSAAAMDLSGAQLDLIAQARPDLIPSVRRALATDPGSSSALDWLNRLQREDPEAHDALVLVIVGGYYSHPKVKELLGYPGQVGEPVDADEYLRYVTEGLLDPVIERGPLYREPPDGSAGPAEEEKAP